MTREFIGGVIDSPIDVRDYKIEVASAQEFPEEFELELIKVKNQGSVGSCVAHAISEVIEYHNKKQENNTTEQSIIYIYGNRRNSSNKKDGMITREALANARNWGDVSRAKLPGNVEVPDAINKFEAVADSFKELGRKNRISTYYHLYNDAEIKTALMNHGPVVMCITWYSDMKVDKSTGILESTFDKKNKVGGHCMVIYGWNKNGWKVQNSWGTLWGIGGKCIIPFGTKFSELWGISDTIVNGDETDIIKPFATKLGEILARILNFILNLFRVKPKKDVKDQNAEETKE